MISCNILVDCICLELRKSFLCCVSTFELLGLERIFHVWECLRKNIPQTQHKVLTVLYKNLSVFFLDFLYNIEVPIFRTNNFIHFIFAQMLERDSYGTLLSVWITSKFLFCLTNGPKIKDDVLKRSFLVSQQNKFCWCKVVITIMTVSLCFHTPLDK